ncbi:hypothetical protein [Sphingomonas sp. Y38-1Y]|uniref:hypothetical protein n=1 Tax=Sphingomonas sp. Y38-1Y TaxID=3078265 RepID=UPI0028EE983E|nr:hypothetical protein [Sphingomonas sp. Y38-1Y]
MDFRKLAVGLGVFSIVLGAGELFAPKKIARTLDAEGGEPVILGFGAREVLTGVGLIAAPAVSAGAWARVAGDVADLTALGVAARRSPDNRAIWGAIAFVLGAAALDLFAARGLDQQSDDELRAAMA